MSKLFVYTVFDACVVSYNQPFYAASMPAALRMLSDSLAKDSMLLRHPDDFLVFELGGFDTESGTLTGYDAPKRVCTIRSLIPDDASPDFLDGPPNV